MAFSRLISPGQPLDGPALNAAMVGIGMGFTGEGDPRANIEDTVLSASVLGMQGELRVLAVLVTWLGVHHERLNADRLVRLVHHQSEPRVRAFWAAVAGWLRSDRRLVRLQRDVAERVDLLVVGTEFQLKRRGEDPRFTGSSLRVPAGVLRDRPEDVLSPRELSLRHAAYRQRIILGPSYRADMWALVETEPGIAPAELARRCYGSFATAWQVKRDVGLLGKGEHVVPGARGTGTANKRRGKYGAPRATSRESSGV